MAIPLVLKAACSKIINAEILAVTSVSGGDINEARCLKTRDKSFFLKFNSGPSAKEMLEKEAAGLRLIAAADTIQVPEIIGLGAAGNFAFLLLEFIPPGEKTNAFWEKFGQQLARMHQESAAFFGLELHNFIGTLRQLNNKHTDWIDFYIQERLVPQINIARGKNLLDKKLDKAFAQLFKKLPELLPMEKPALLHGDLWSGNFLAGKGEQPYLIDPAVCYGNREMDLAMTRLFGGFAPAFYQNYNNIYPLIPGFEKRIEIYQLYYLLVHLNLFGRSYLSPVRNILHHYV